MEEQKPKGSGMEKIATFIVDKRNLFFLLYAFALIFSIVATGWVKVENDITTYLPEDTETRQGLTVMNDNFVTYGTARVMVSNVTYETAEISAVTWKALMALPAWILMIPRTTTNQLRRCSA